MKYTLLFLLMLPALGYAEIYKWTDKDGLVHFGDRPYEAEDAEKVNVQINSYENVTIQDANLLDYISRKKSATPEIVMYATSWCKYCKKARNYFRKNNISYTEYDIEKNQQAKKEYDELGGRGVPVILVGEKRMNGFSEAGFDRLFKREKK